MTDAAPQQPDSQLPTEQTFIDAIATVESSRTALDKKYQLVFQFLKYFAEFIDWLDRIKMIVERAAYNGETERAQHVSTLRQETLAGRSGLEEMRRHLGTTPGEHLGALVEKADAALKELESLLEIDPAAT